MIPLWIDQIKNGNPITLTEPSMTRFIMSLEKAVDLVLFAFEHGENGDLLIQKAPACTIQTQAEAVCELFGGKKEDIKVIGIRHGEKMYETLLTNEESLTSWKSNTQKMAECKKPWKIGIFWKKILKKQEETVLKVKEKYDSEMMKLKDLYAKRNEEKKKELLKAVENSTKTYEEIMAFICSEGEIN